MLETTSAKTLPPEIVHHQRCAPFGTEMRKVPYEAQCCDLMKGHCMLPKKDDWPFSLVARSPAARP